MQGFTRGTEKAGLSEIQNRREMGKIRHLQRLTPALIAIFYFIVYGRYGFSNTDDGFMTGFAWRIFNGETIYKDFIYVRTPLTPLIHAFVMNLVPINYYILSERALFYVVILFYSHLASVVLKNIFPDDKSLRDYGWVYTSTFFVFSVHNFPPCAWYTIDGICLSVVGAYFLLGKRNTHYASVIVAAASLVASALTKQSFYLMPLIGSAYLFVARRKMKDICLYLATCIALLFVFILALKHFGVLDDFLYQTSNATHLRDAVRAGLITYFREGGSYLGYCLLFVACARVVIPMLPDRLSFLSVMGRPLMVFFSIFLIRNLLIVAVNIRHPNSSFMWIEQMDAGYSQAMLLIAAYWTIEELRTDLTRGASFFVLMMIAWSASISWGYQTPLLFSAPLVFGVVQMARRFGSLNVTPIKVCSLVLAFGIVGYAFCNLFPYRDLDGRIHDHRDLGKLAPRLRGIMSGDKGWEKLAEFLDLQRRYGDRFITLSAFTTSHFITGTINPAPADWLHNSEVASKSGEIFSRLNSEEVYAIVDIQERNADANEDSLQRSDFSSMVEANWRLLKVGKSYKVYATSKYVELHGMEP